MLRLCLLGALIGADAACPAAAQTAPVADRLALRPDTHLRAPKADTPALLQERTRLRAYRKAHDRAPWEHEAAEVPSPAVELGPVAAPAQTAPPDILTPLPAPLPPDARSAGAATPPAAAPTAAPAGTAEDAASPPPANPALQPPPAVPANAVPWPRPRKAALPKDGGSDLRALLLISALVLLLAAGLAQLMSRLHRIREASEARRTLFANDDGAGQIAGMKKATPQDGPSQ